MHQSLSEYFRLTTPLTCTLSSCSMHLASQSAHVRPFQPAHLAALGVQKGRATPLVAPSLRSSAIHRSVGPVSCSAASMQEAPSQQSSRQYESLKGSMVYQVAEQRKTDITELWGADEVAVIFWARSMGCFFCQELARELKRDVLPKLQAEGIKSFLVTIGTPKRGLEFAELTSYPAENLLADPENVTYDALSLKRNPIDTYFNPRTPLAIAERFRRDGAKVLREALSTWKPWIPPGKGQAQQQGGCFIFKGRECVYEYKDPATGRHVNIEEVVRTALQLV